MSMPFILEYMPYEKVAALLRPQQQVKTAVPVGKMVKTVAKGLAGFGVGTAAGYGTGALIGKIYEGTTGEKIPSHLLVPAATLLGAGMGLAYSMYKTKEQEELHRVLKAERDKSAGGTSGK